jgi:hypothetical protein
MVIRSAKEHHPIRTGPVLLPACPHLLEAYLSRTDAALGRVFMVELFCFFDQTLNFSAADSLVKNA